MGSHLDLLKAHRYFVLFMAISFLGWAAETVFFGLSYGGLYDRGFMTLPFCTIYGFSLLLLYALIGTPGQGGALLGTVRSRPLRVLLYFGLSMLLPTTLELVTGLFFDRVFGLRLWDYTGYRYQLGGYICLEYSLLWGILIPICMEWLFLPLKNRVFALPERPVTLLSGGIALLSLLDWGVNFARLA